MGLFGAMTASVSGLSAQGESISVISDNLANTNTIGYKASRALFSQLVTSSGAGGTTYNAGGVGSSIGRNQKEQGSLNATSSVTDLAITGNGFFRVSDSSVLGTSTSYYYTRAGSFSEDKEGFLVTPDGFFLQGWRTTSDGTISNLQDIVNVELKSVGVSAQETTEFAIGANLNKSSTVSAYYDTSSALSAAMTNILADPSTRANYTSDIRLYDAQGGARDVNIAFTKRSANLWDWQMLTDGSNIQGGTSGTNTSISSGTLRFDTSGNLKYVTGANLTANWSSGVEPSTVTANFGDYTGGKIVTGTTGLDYTDHVLDIAIENESFGTGDFNLYVSANAAGTATVELRDAANVVLDTTTVSTTAATREIYFSTSKVRVTVSNNMVIPAATNTIGTSFTVATVNSLDEGLGSDGVVQFASDNNTSFVNQNGFGSGTLSAIEIDEDGFVAGTFTNGETKKLFRVALGVFQNPSGLEAVSGSLLRVTDSSGQALIKQPGLAGTGRIVSGALEGSTTDIAGEFSSMIVAQRAFQASSKVITTVDQMLSELLQLR